MLKSYKWMVGRMEISDRTYSKSTCGANNTSYFQQPRNEEFDVETAQIIVLRRITDDYNYAEYFDKTFAEYKVGFDSGYTTGDNILGMTHCHNSDSITNNGIVQKNTKNGTVSAV